MKVELNKTFAAVHSMVEEWTKRVLAELESDETCYGVRAEEIENKSRDGFMAFTAGGWEGIGYANLGYQMGSGSYPQMMQSHVDRAEEATVETWEESHPGKRVADLDQDSADWESFCEFENEFQREQSDYFFKVRALYLDGDTTTQSDSGEPEVYFMVGINTDFEYGRDYVSWLSAYGGDPHCTKWLWEKTVRVADLTPEMINPMSDEAYEALAKA